MTLSFEEFSGSVLDVREVLDITALKETGPELQKAIINAVKDTQSVVEQILPNVLVMTVEQYKDLDPAGDLYGAYSDKQRYYLTPYNAMDIVVRDKQNLEPLTEGEIDEPEA